MDRMTSGFGSLKNALFARRVALVALVAVALSVGGAQAAHRASANYAFDNVTMESLLRHLGELMDRRIEFLGDEPQMGVTIHVKGHEPMEVLRWLLDTADIPFEYRHKYNIVAIADRNENGGGKRTWTTHSRESFAGEGTAPPPEFATRLPEGDHYTGQRLDRAILNLAQEAGLNVVLLGTLSRLTLDLGYRVPTNSRLILHSLLDVNRVKYRIVGGDTLLVRGDF